MGSWTEDELHRWLSEQAWPARLVGSRGHDAAVLQPVDGALAICADQCIEGVHFLASAGGRAVGRKAVLRTLSDLAATAAQPVAITLTVKAPASAEAIDVGDWLRAALTGANDAAMDHGCELVAGDLAMAEGPITLSVTAVGRVPGTKGQAATRTVGRDRARAGQVVVLSGPVGGSLPFDRHLEPRPRIFGGLAAAAAGATAMMDVSDGLAWDLYRLARASGVQVRLDVGAVRIHPDAERAAEEGHHGRAVSAVERALHDGEDHELIATLDTEAWARWGPRAVEDGWHVIGEVHDLGDDKSCLELDHLGHKTPWEPGPGRGWTYEADAPPKEDH